MKLGRRRAAELQWRLDSMGTTQPVYVPRKPQAIKKSGKWDWLLWTGYIILWMASAVFTYNFFRGTP